MLRWAARSEFGIRLSILHLFVRSTDLKRGVHDFVDMENVAICFSISEYTNHSMLDRVQIFILLFLEKNGN